MIKWVNKNIQQCKDLENKRSNRNKIVKIFLACDRFNRFRTQFSTYDRFLNTVYSTNIIEQMFTLIEKFRHIIRMKKENNANFRFHFAFFVDENSTFSFFSSNVRWKEENKRLFFREKSIELSHCVCEEKH